MGSLTRALPLRDLQHIQSEGIPPAQEQGKSYSTCRASSDELCIPSTCCTETVQTPFGERHSGFVHEQVTAHASCYRACKF